METQIGQSANNFRIFSTEIDKEIYNQAVNILGFSTGFATLLSKMGFQSLDEVEKFVNPKIKDLMPNPLVLLDMDLAVSHLYRAILNRKKIGILSDYDVDGVTSASTLITYLRWIGIEAEIIIPDRFKDGYGPSKSLFQKLHDRGVHLIITLDCGTVAFEPIEFAVALGMDVIVIDHHISSHEKPNAVAIVNPNQYGDKSGLGYLCAAGVTFMLCTALNAHLRENNYFTASKEPNLLNLLHFTAMGTVCDMMRMEGLNRAFYRSGLKHLSEQLSRINSMQLVIKPAFIGMNALMQIGGIKAIKSSYDIGFILGPMINAGGRIDSAMIGVDLFTCDTNDKAQELAMQLKLLNEERRDTQLKIIENANIESEKVIALGKKVIFLADKDWHQGVIGIVAARVKDTFSLPTIIGSVIIENDKEVIKASCRSLSGVDIGACVMNAVKKGLLLKGGGHSGAAGFSCLLKDYDKVYDFFEEHLGESVMYANERKRFNIAGEIMLSQITEKFCNELTMLEPFGVSNPVPLFLIKDAIVVSYKILKDKHYKVFLRQKNHHGNAKYYNAICFGAVDTTLGLEISRRINDEIKPISEISYDEKFGISIIIKDILLT